MPKPLMRWAWTSRGHVDDAEMAAANSMSLEELRKDTNKVNNAYRDFVELEQWTDPLESHENAQNMAEPLPCERKKIWLIATDVICL